VIGVKYKVRIINYPVCQQSGEAEYCFLGIYPCVFVQAAAQKLLIIYWCNV